MTRPATQRWPCPALRCLAVRGTTRRTSSSSTRRRVRRASRVQRYALSPPAGGTRDANAVEARRSSRGTLSIAGRRYGSILSCSCAPASRGSRVTIVDREVPMSPPAHPSPDDQLEFVLHAVSRSLLRTYNDEFRKLGMSQSQAGVLLQVDWADAHTQTEIARR